MSDKCDLGLIGLAVMGQNFVLNVESKGYRVAVYNRSREKTDEFLNRRADGKNIKGCYTLEELVDSLTRPRKVMLLVKAGDPVDAVIESLIPLLDRDDIIIDGGNSYFRDTDRRAEKMEKLGIRYLGTGISGGEYGALHGPSLMLGGDRQAYQEIKEIFREAAAQTEEGPCVGYLGPGSAGHYVKMVHNGIEYGVMALTAEIYDFMRKILELEPEEMAEHFARWNKSRDSYLLEITAEILRRDDDKTEEKLIDVILDTAGQKGTGKWSVQDALELGIAVPCINAAVNSRLLSAARNERLKISRELGGLKLEGLSRLVGVDRSEESRSGVDRSGVGSLKEGRQRVDRSEEERLGVDRSEEDRSGESSLVKQEGDRLREILPDYLEAALAFGILIAYAEGLKLLEAASEEYGYELDLAEVARIWQDGCIIRANLLQEIRRVYREEEPVNLFFSPRFRDQITGSTAAVRKVVEVAKAAGLAMPALTSALDYYDSLRAEESPANLIQAQRDYFGAHTYQRKDREGVFHTEWQDIHNI